MSGSMTSKEKQKKIRTYLNDFLENIKESPKGPYLKSKQIAEELGLSSKEVGTNLKQLAEEEEDLVIEQNSRSATGSVWMIKHK